MVKRVYFNHDVAQTKKVREGKDSCTAYIQEMTGLSEVEASILMAKIRTEPVRKIKKL